MRKLEASYRVMKVLKLLNDGPLGFEELCYELAQNDIAVNRETIGKYFTTLREAGCKIDKKGGKFWLKHMPLFVCFTRTELETLAIFQKFAQKLHQKRVSEKVQSTFNKILKMTSIELHSEYHAILNAIKFDDVYCKNKDKLDIFSDFFAENSQKLKITYRGESFKIRPKSFKYETNKVYLFALNEKNMKYEHFLLDDVGEILSLIQLSPIPCLASTTVFKLTGRLARGYYPLEGEVVNMISADNINVVNKVSVKRELHSRLLKYGELCEIISPKDEREAFIGELDEMIENYNKTS